MPVYDALLGSPLRHILVRHEQGAALAANGYARATGRVGVCMATSGPGAANLLTGIADAHLDSVPVVAITGQVPSAALGTDAFQEMDVLGVFLPVVKHSFLVRSVDDLPQVVAEAFRIAREGRPGPVLIDLPKDIAQARTTARPLGPPRGHRRCGCATRGRSTPRGRCSRPAAGRSSTAGAASAWAARSTPSATSCIAPACRPCSR